MSKIKIIPIFVPHLGCPNECVFCNQNKITGIKKLELEKVKETIDGYLKIFSNSNNIELAFYGGSFTAIEKKLQEELLRIALELKEKKLINRIRISTRPDCINEEIIKFLKLYKVDIIELGVQSLDEDVLKLSKRGHDKESVYKSANLIKMNGFTLGLQQMIGLPGDNEEKSIKTTYEIISLKPDFVRIYPTLVIKDTELAEMYYNKTFIPYTIKESIDITTKLIMIYESYNINIIRVGLQSTENLKFNKDVVAGPLNDAFREYCESEKLFQIIKYSNIKTDNENIKIISSPRNISLLVGQKGKNKKKLIDYFNISHIKFIGDKNINSIIKIISKDTEYNIDINETLKNIVKGWEDVFKKH